MSQKDLLSDIEEIPYICGEKLLANQNFVNNVINQMRKKE